MEQNLPNLANQGWPTNECFSVLMVAPYEKKTTVE